MWLEVVHYIKYIWLFFIGSSSIGELKPNIDAKQVNELLLLEDLETAHVKKSIDSDIFPIKSSGRPRQKKEVISRSQSTSVMTFQKQFEQQPVRVINSASQIELPVALKNSVREEHSPKPESSNKAWT